MPEKRRLVASYICLGSEIAGLLDYSNNKYALAKLLNLKRSNRFYKNR